MKIDKEVIFQEYPEILNVKHVCEMLGVSKSYVYKLIINGYIKAIRIGTRYKIPKIYVIEYLNHSMES